MPRKIMTEKKMPLPLSCGRFLLPIDDEPGYSRCKGRNHDECTKEGSSCVWIVDPTGPQGSYCRGNNNVQRE